MFNKIKKMAQWVWDLIGVINLYCCHHEELKETLHLGTIQRSKDLEKEVLGMDDLLIQPEDTEGLTKFETKNTCNKKEQ